VPLGRCIKYEISHYKSEHPYGRESPNKIQSDPSKSTPGPRSHRKTLLDFYPAYTYVVT